MSNVLVVGSGGRETMLATYLSKSKKCKNVYLAPGNDTKYNSNIIRVDAKPDYPLCDGLLKFIRNKNISLVVGGSENDLAKNLGDIIRMNNIPFVGASGAASLFESDKIFASLFRKSQNIPQPYFEIFNKKNDALVYGAIRFDNYTSGLVVKYPGLAGGKGVIVTETYHDYYKAVNDISKYGEQFIVEDMIKGTEISTTVLVKNPNDYIILSFSQDYKRAGNGDTGLNTGGMGAVTLDLDEDFVRKIDKEIIYPTICGAEKINRTMQGSVLYIGLMVNKYNNPHVLEYNMRFGDPEAQVIIPRIESDLWLLLSWLANKDMSFNGYKMKKEHYATIIMAAKGYPSDYSEAIGKEIHGLKKAIREDSASINLAATRYKDGKYYVNGSRNINIIGKDGTLNKAIKNAYTTANKINSNGLFYRTDIGCNVNKDIFI
jgi:phosphoribosylamine--glycine ligase